MIAKFFDRNGHDVVLPAARHDRPAQPALTSEVRATRNYGMFKIDRRNRPISQKKVDRLVKAIERKNLLAEFPIVVDADGRVIDGQHRLTAAKILGVPIHYIVSTTMELSDVPKAASETNNWKTADYVHHFCESGMGEYKKLRDFHQTYHFIGLAQCAALCHYGDREGWDFADGGYRANDLPFATRVAEAVLDFAEYFDFAKTQSFISAISNLMANSQYDHARMMKKVKYLHGRVQRMGDSESYIAALSNLYNHGVKADRRILLSKIYPKDSRYRTDRLAA